MADDISDERPSPTHFRWMCVILLLAGVAGVLLAQPFAYGKDLALYIIFSGIINIAVMMVFSTCFYRLYFSPAEDTISTCLQHSMGLLILLAIKFIYLTATDSVVIRTCAPPLSNECQGLIDDAGYTSPLMVVGDNVLLLLVAATTGAILMRVCLSVETCKSNSWISQLFLSKYYQDQKWNDTNDDPYTTPMLSKVETV